MALPGGLSLLTNRIAHEQPITPSKRAHELRPTRRIWSKKAIFWRHGLHLASGVCVRTNKWSDRILCKPASASVRCYALLDPAVNRRIRASMHCAHPLCPNRVRASRCKRARRSESPANSDGNEKRARLRYRRIRGCELRSTESFRSGITESLG
jgi:hypothetical protein